LPICAVARQNEPASDSLALKEYVRIITSGPGFRNINDTAALNATARYICNQLEKLTGRKPWIQTYVIKGKSYSNIGVFFGPENAPRIIIGAHYDACGDQAGADDNASGVAALLDLARIMATQPHDKWNKRVDIVAYTLEEPPSFDSPDMGSAVHAQSLWDEKVPVVGMVSVEMIGFYRQARNTQRYPIGALRLLYGSRANFITVVKRLHGGKFSRRFTRGFKRGNSVVTKVFPAPKWVPGVDLSDHMNYWSHGWDALMITDTSFFRNSNYHRATDTPETLDYARMSFVVNKLFKAVSRAAM
jgi:Zn-dependent M28 family amino/carboxypeptidase